MSINVMILGESGTGKTASLRNMPPSETLLIQVVKKPLPFKAAGWSRLDKDTNPQGNIIVNDDSAAICQIMVRTRRKTIIIDDFQYMLANEYMRRSSETGYGKFTDIGRHTWDVLTKSSSLPDDVCVYFLAHTQLDENGKEKMKTIGKMLDEKLTPEGLFSIVLKTQVREGEYFFSTKNNGYDTVKSPLGLFDTDLVDNDLDHVNLTIRKYYEI